MPKGYTENMEERLTAVTASRPSSRALLVTLLAIAGGLALAHVVLSLTDIQILIGYFDVNQESSIPTWWSSIQLLALSVLLALVARANSDRDRGYRRVFWVGSAIAAFFSADEMAMLHERIIGALYPYDAIPRFTGNNGIWIFVYGVVGIVILSLIMPGLIRFVRTEKRASIRLFVGGGLFVLGGVGVEAVGYYVDPPLGLVEETLEIVGVALMVWAIYGLLENTVVEFPTRRTG